MRANEIKKENKYRNSSISRVEGMKATLRLVPSLESVVKSFNQVIANIIFKGFNTNVFCIGEITLLYWFWQRTQQAENQCRHALVLKKEELEQEQVLRRALNISQMNAKELQVA